MTDAGRYLDDTAIICDAIRELRRQAINGVAPTRTVYTANRHPDAPCGTTIVDGLGIEWDRFASRAGLEFHGGRGRQYGDPMARELPRWLTEELKYDRVCECGAPATLVGRFVSVTATGSQIGNAFLLCAECAGLVDAGVRVEGIGEGI